MFGKRKSNEDPRDQVGKNPTGRERRSSGGKRRQARTKLERDLEGTRYEEKKRD